MAIFKKTEKRTDKANLKNDTSTPLDEHYILKVCDRDDSSDESTGWTHHIRNYVESAFLTKDPKHYTDMTSTFYYCKGLIPDYIEPSKDYAVKSHRNIILTFLNKENAPEHNWINQYCLNEGSNFLDSDDIKNLHNNFTTLAEVGNYYYPITDLSEIENDDGKYLLDNAEISVRSNYGGGYIRINGKEREFKNYYFKNVLKDLFESRNNVSSTETNIETIDFGKLSNKELSNLMIEQLSKHRLDSKENRIEFFKFLSSFNSSHYSLRNKLILAFQANSKKFLRVYGTYKEWHNRNTRIKDGSKAMEICLPIEKKTYFQKSVSNGITTWIRMPYPKDDKTRDYYDNLVTAKEARVAIRTEFMYKKAIFSLSQTTMSEADRVKYLQRYNSNNTKAENDKYLDRMKRIVAHLGYKYSEIIIEGEALGYTSYKNKEIVLQASVPTDTKILTAAHEIAHVILNHDTMKLTGTDREIQAELLAHTFCASINIKSETEHSLNYLNSYLESYHPESKGDLSFLETIEKSVLFAHSSIVLPAVQILHDLVSNDKMTLVDLKRITDFAPNGYVYDKLAKEAKVLTRRELQQEQEVVQENIMESENVPTNVFELE
ncbi:MAG: ImmA/IrrE family metallo-endopeptidase [Erysipelotrichales bacterium]|nr:ImmA/IrrE family metallo-endopeptidase [Erysipelotrichales bacterium]